jgi:hypothetical protein
MTRFLALLAFASVQGLFAVDTPADSPDYEMTEEQQVSLLLNATRASVESLQRLQDALKAFRSQEAICIKADDNAEALYRLSESALKLWNNIHESRVEPYFRKAFLDELEQISRPARGKEIPPICEK